MTTIIIGLFPTQKEAKNLAADLENGGFKNEDYIVYLNKKEEQKATFWETLFGGRTPQFNTQETDTLIASVSIKSEEQLAIAKQIFEKYSVVHTYEFDDITIVEAQSLDYLRTKVALRAKSEVYSSMIKKNTAQNIHSEVSGEFSFDLY